MQRKKRGKLFVNIRRVLIVFAVLVIGLVGCSKEASVTEQIYDHLEESVSLESDYAKYQQEIFELEQEEQDIYNKVVDLTEDDFAEIVSLSKDALEIIDEREEIMALEQESISNSKEEFLDRKSTR